MELVYSPPQPAVMKTVSFTRFKNILLKNDCVTPPCMRESARRIFADTLKKNRYEILGNGQPYSIILNGYGDLKYVEMMDGTKHPAKKMIQKMQVFLDS
jgi:hypothetical protein